ncbi:MAG: SusC/RagA family TonB-linked outer membrane protein [Dysgonamonadaceae bacterium]|jgi:TonB-linked SusC/RagA family outer membrane protein|nr:SusC/RagA family TonB-linked outer membrane protein [Dysgonamonadaceae bacterium]
MQITITAKKRRKYRMTIFVISCLFSILPLVAQNDDLDTLSIKSPVINSTDVVKPNVLLGEQDPETLIQSVSTVSGDRLLHRPAFQMEQFLDGTLPGLYVKLNNGYPTENLDLYMRRENLLIVVDGVPRSDVNLSPNQIESVSLIKDGLGLAAWGMSSGEGVLFIKTKRGVANKIKIDFTAQYAQTQQTYRPEPLDAYSYADLLNKAIWYDASPANVNYNGATPMYSADDLEKYRTGSSPYTHPNNDWHSLLMHDKAPVQQYNLNLSGGSELARYFIDINMFDQRGFLKQDRSINSYNTQESFKKWSLRTNVDVNLTQSTLMQVNLFGQMYRENTPGYPMMDGIYSGMYSTPANAYPIFNPPADLEGKGNMIQTYGGTPNYNNNLYAMSLETGYMIYPQTDLNFDIALEHRFTDVLNGLYVKGLYSYNSSYREGKLNIKQPDVWYYNPNDLSYMKILTSYPRRSISGYARQNRLQYVELNAGYDFKKGLNSSNTRVTYWNNQFIVHSANIPLHKQGVNIHSNYDFDKKYMAEISLSANSLNFLKPGYQWGFFPAAGLGWNISKEDFFNIPAINTLKLRSTIGLNGMDGTGSYFRSGTGSMTSYYYTYMSIYGSVSDNQVILGQGSTPYTALGEISRPYIVQWEKNLRFTLGIDAEILDKSIKLGAEYFNNKSFDGLSVNVAKGYSTIPGISANEENIAASRQQGLEIDLTYQKQFGDFSIVFNPSMTLYKAIVLENGEPVFPEPYMQYVGRDARQAHGYIAEGIFQSQDEIDKYLQDYHLDGYIPKPGDIKYKDLNNDHIIDALDVDEIYSNAPRIEYGLYFNAGWKGLNLSMQWTGLANYETVIQDMPFINLNGSSYGNAYKKNLDYWTPDNPNASYPRLSASSTNNVYNMRTSTFWVKDCSYLTLKNIELSYSLPQNWMESIRIAGIKVFVNAYNPIIFSPLKYGNPMMGSSNTKYIPDIKAYNIGLNVQF